MEDLDGLFQFIRSKKDFGLYFRRRLRFAHSIWCGVVYDGSKAIMVREENLVDAIAASCAVPYMFSPMVFEGTLYRDGGFADRIGLRAWKSIRPDPDQPLCAHIVDRSNGVPNEEG